MGEDPNRQGTSRRWIVHACEESLRRLRTDHIDLYQVHRFRTDTDFDDDDRLHHHGPSPSAALSEPGRWIQVELVAGRRSPSPRTRYQ